MRARTTVLREHWGWYGSGATIGGVLGGFAGSLIALLDGEPLTSGVTPGAVTGGLLGLAWVWLIASDRRWATVRIGIAVTLAALLIGAAIALLVDGPTPSSTASSGASQTPRRDPKGGSTPPLHEAAPRKTEVREGLRYISEAERPAPALRLCKSAEGDSRRTAAEARYCTASAYALQERWSQALRTVEAAIVGVGSKVPTRYRLLRARVLAKLPDRVIEARGEVDRALQADATDSSLWVFDAYIANVLGDYPGALESAATALGYEPSAATAHTERAIALTALGDREQALSEAQAALDLGNDDHRALSVIARLRSDAGDHDGAIGAWSDAIRRSGRRVPAWYLRQLGYEQYQARHYAAAAETLNRAIERDPKDPDALRIQGDVAAADERPRDAIGYYDRAASLRAYDPLLLRNRALALRQLNRPRRALQTLSLLTRRERDWNGGQAYFDSGLILLYDLHKPDSARLQFEAAIQRSPEWGEARYQLAQALWRLPTYAQPMHRALLENAFAEAIRCDPNDARSFRDRGYFRYGLGGRTQDAFDDFQRATQLDDDDPWSHYYLGFYGLDEIGADARSSLAEIDRAIDLSKEPEFFRGRAYILAFRERNYPAAYGAIDRAMKRDREFLPAYFVKSLIILDEERASPARGRQRALKVLTAAATAVDGRQARASIAWVRGDVLLGLEDPKGALREYDQALKITPNEPALQLSKAESLIKLGRWQAALNAVDTAIARSDAYSAAYMKKAYVLLQPLTPVCDVKGAQDALKIARSLDPTSPNLAELESFAAGKGAEHCAPDASQA